ncbi:MAG: hypothetical protein HOV81_14270 [Kofleriaceae bacterium]|nr:hypothetical protein [Kofleriaceae bacterium]
MVGERMSWTRVHRWLAIVLVVPLVVWSVSGLLFHLKPGWSRAYDMLDAERPVLSTTSVAPIATIAATFPAKISKVELFDTAIGPLYRVTTESGTELVDAVGATRRSPLSADDAKALAVDAVTRSAERAGYGIVIGTEVTERVVHVKFEHATVDVGRASARLSQRGSDTDRIDWLYRIHYLQWTGNKAVDKVLVALGLALIWAVMLPGIVLFVRRAVRR